MLEKGRVRKKESERKIERNCTTKFSECSCQKRGIGKLAGEVRVGGGLHETEVDTKAKGGLETAGETSSIMASQKRD